MKISSNVGPINGLDKTQTEKAQADKVSLKSDQSEKKGRECSRARIFGTCELVRVCS